MSALSPKELKFIEEYRKHGVGSKAVVAAGYSETGASVTANRLLKRPKVAAEMARRDSKSEKNAESLVDTIRREILNLATVDPADIWTDDHKLKPLNEIPEAARRAISTINDKGIKTHSKLGALELLAKVTGMVKEQQTQQQAVQIIIAAPPARPAVSVESAKLLPEWD
jgi:Terminase small subunit